MTPSNTHGAMSAYYQFPDLTGMPGLPPPNPNLPEKAWSDPNASATEPMTYDVWNESDTSPAVRKLVVPPEQRFANLPGEPPVFPPYAPAATTAVGSIPNGFSSNQIAPLLSMRAEADALAALIPGTAVIDPYDPAVNSFEHVVYPPGELRRTWVLKYPSGLEAFVGTLLAAENAKGVGFPGSWDAGSGGLVWVPGAAPTGAVAPGPAVPFPLLLPTGAKLVAVSVGAGLSTVEVQLSEPVPASTGGGLTAAQDQRLARIESMLDALLAADRVPIPPG